MEAKKDKFKEYRPVFIRWCDALCIDESWSDLKTVKEWAENNTWVVEQLGFLIEENEKYILLANHILDYYENPKFGDVIKIPTTWILEKKFLDLN